VILFKNAGVAACEVEGFPFLVGLDASNRALGHSVHAPKNGPFGGPARAIRLKPGQSASTIGQTVGVQVNTSRPCADYQSVLVSLPNSSRTLRVPLMWHPSSPGERGLSVCGTLLVSPFSAGVKTFYEAHPTQTTGTQPPYGPTTSTPGASGTLPCGGQTLTVNGGRQGGGAVGYAEGTVVLTNVGKMPCTLSGTPSMSLLTAAGTILDVSNITPATAPGTPVRVAPSSSAVLIVYWANWCGPPPGNLQIRLVLDGTTEAIAGPFDGPPSYNFVPACTDSAQPSTLQVVHGYALQSA
jgi:hypothetical protein